jgi:hypothetical protein
MRRYHRGTDVTQVVRINVGLSEMVNLYVVILDSKYTVVKQMAVNAETGFIVGDMTVVDDNTIEVRVHRNETTTWEFGNFHFKVYALYVDTNFEDSIRIESNSELAFRLVYDIDSTTDAQTLDLSLPSAMVVEIISIVNSWNDLVMGFDTIVELPSIPSGAVYQYGYLGGVTYYRFIANAGGEDSFYRQYSTGVFNDLIVTKKVTL